MLWENEIRNGEITASAAQVGMLKLIVHHWVGCGDTWFMSCYGIFDKVELPVMSLNEAQVMAAARFQLMLEEAIEAIYRVGS